MRLTKNNLSNSLNAKKDFLLKFSYVDSTKEGKLSKDLVRSLLIECSNRAFILYACSFLSEFIMPYFTVDRTTFNRIRSRFVKHLLTILIHLRLGYQQSLMFECYYYLWVSQVRDEMNKECKLLADELCIKLSKYSKNIQNNSRIISAYP